MPKNHKEILLSEVRRSLDSSGITYGVMECDSEFADTAAFCQKYGISPAICANTIIVAGKGSSPKFAACVIMATTKLDVNKKVCELMEVKRASFARLDQIQSYTGMKIGGVTAFGLPTNSPIYIDSNVLKMTEIIMGGGNRSSKLRLDPRELQKLANITVVEELAQIR